MSLESLFGRHCLACADFRVLAAVIALCVHGTVAAQTEIHKCTDADGGIVYSQLPCAVTESGSEEVTDDDERMEPAQPDPFTDEVFAAEAQEPERKTAEEVAACKKRFRDAIDVIDAEIARDYSVEQADAYKERLLELTRQLRRC